MYSYVRHENNRIEKHTHCVAGGGGELFVIDFPNEFHVPHTNVTATTDFLRSRGVLIYLCHSRARTTVIVVVHSN